MSGSRLRKRAALLIAAACVGVAIAWSPSCGRQPSGHDPGGGSGLWHEVSYETTRLV